jgi:hypothetical protein
MAGRDESPLAGHERFGRREAEDLRIAEPANRPALQRGAERVGRIEDERGSRRVREFAHEPSVGEDPAVI